MYLKLAGGACLLLSCLGGCAELWRRDRLQLCRIDGYLHLLAFIRGEVEGYLTPQARIFEKCPPQILIDCGHRAATPPRELGELIGEGAAHGELDGECLRALRELAASFGRSWRGEELRLCDRAALALTARRTALASELPARRRASISAVLCAAAAIIVFI